MELTVKVININTYAGSKLLEKCKVLNEYSQFVEAVRNFRKEGDADYMKKAIQYCIDNHILEEYLSRKGSEVMNFLCAEYDYEMDMQVKKEEAYEEGFDDGFGNGFDNGFLRGVSPLIKHYLAENLSKEDILLKLKEEFSVSDEEAKKTLDGYLENNK